MDDLEAVREISQILEKFESEDKSRIVRWVLEKVGISMQAQASGTGRAAGVEGASHSPKDIRAFVAEKSPSSDNQFAAVVGYYYAFEAPPNENKTSITSVDLTDACRKAGRARLGDPVKTLANAHGMGYFDKVGRGEYKLNTVGENLVAMTLPAGTGEDARRIKKVSRKKAIANKKPAKKAAKKAITKQARKPRR